MQFAESVWYMLILLGIMVIVHEWGHFVAARWFDVKVETFSVGFGPRLFGYRRGDTDWRFSIIPLGGYVKMYGEQPGEQGSDDPRSFLAKPRWQRIIIALAGPLMNILLAIVLVTGLFMVRYPKIANADGPAVVGNITKGSAAEQSGVREGDRIATFDGKDNPTWEDVLMTELTGANRIIAFTVERQGKLVNLTITPRADEKTGGAGSAGWFPQSEVIVKGVNLDMDAAKQGLKPGDVILAVNNVAIRSVGKLHEVVRSTEGKTAEVLFARNGERQTIRVTPSFKQVEGEAKPRYLLGVTLEPKVELVALPFQEAFSESLKRNWKDAGMIYSFLRGMVEARVSPKQLEGPVRIAQIAREAAREGFWAFVGLMSMVSLNLAIFNLLPIPILDGGVILMLLIEMIARRDLSVRVKETILKVAFVFLITLVVFVLYNDIAKVLRG